MSVIKSTKAGRKHPKPTLHNVHIPLAHAVKPAGYFRWKRILGCTMAALLLVAGLPMIGLLVLLVRLTSRGPGLYRQRRVGLNGRAFMLFKIRTMRLDAEVETGATWAHASDARVTPVGKVLRRLHLDELPQLFNVLKGEMALIGPRPERPEFVHVLAEAIPGYLNRLAVPPGITGLAQLNLPPDTDLNSVRRKLVLDIEYIGHAHLWMDIRLFICTFARLFKLPASTLLRISGLSRTVAIPSDNSHSGNGTNGSNHTVATPDTIVVQAINPSAVGDSKHSHDNGNGSDKNPKEALRHKPR